MPLFRKLNDDDLDKMKDNGDVKGLIKALKNKDAGVRQSAAILLGHLYDPLSVEPLIKAFQEDPDEMVRVFAAATLAGIADPRILYAFIPILNDSNEYTRAAARTGLEGVCDKLGIASLALGLLETGRVFEPLLEILRGTNEELRKLAIQMLGKLGDLRAFEPLLEALKDPDIRNDAIEALGDLGDTRAIKPLLKLVDELSKEETMTVGDLGTLAIIPPSLGKIGASGVDSLLNALSDPNEKVRAFAAAALGETRDTRAVEALIVALTDVGPGVRNGAALALGRIGDSRAIEPLKVARKDKVDYVRATAAEALQRCKK